MERHTRLVVAGHPHLIYLRGNNRRLLFASHADRLLWVECVGRALDVTKCRLHQMTLVRAAVYMIVTPTDEVGLSDVVKRACERYTPTRNRQRGGSGRLFEVGFRSRALLDLEQVRTTTLHHDATAFRVGDATDPFVHPWSTAALHAGRLEGRKLRPIWTPSRWYAQLGRTSDERARAYRRAMAEYLERGEAPPVDERIAADEKENYRRRIERPDGRWARERQLQYGPKTASDR
ncbi:MAG: hypothetical protein K8M05_28460 [Deltaproteobacteria bacterium]|nr:hypothetical protein [Kofleriaceae bacterium]